MIREDGLGECKLQYAGGLSVVCEWPSRDAAAQNLNAQLETLKHWFSDLHLWEEGIIPQERLAWLEIDGLPIEAWNEHNFRNVASKFGRVLEVDDIAFDGSMTSTFGVLILTKQAEDVNSVVRIKVHNNLCKVKVIEDHNRSLELRSAPSFQSDYNSDGENLDQLIDDVSDTFSDDLVPESEMEDCRQVTNDFINNLWGDVQSDRVPMQPSRPTGRAHGEFPNPLSSALSSGKKMSNKSRKGVIFFGEGSPTSEVSRPEVAEEILDDHNKANFGEKIGITYENPEGDVARKGKWSGVDIKIGLLNIYGPHKKADKEILWRNLLNVISTQDCVWILLGDFNAVRRQEERSGTFFDSDEAACFNNFISCAGLHDIQFVGRRFTRFNKAGTKMSKLDRYLVSANFFNHWKDAMVYVLARSFSDHCPIMLKSGEVDYGPKPFKLFDHWLENEEFQNLVKVSWTSKEVAGTGDVVLKEKLKYLKHVIKSWTKEKLEARLKEKESILNALKGWDEKAEANLLTPGDVSKRENMLFELSQIEQKEASELKQKSRIRWAVEGDENSTFFHASVNHKWRSKQCKGLIHNGEWKEDPKEVMEVAKSHFAERFIEPSVMRPKFWSSNFKKLSSQDIHMIERPFSMEEIKEAVWDCDGSKAPGPDGFNFNFIKKFWEVIKKDIFAAVKNFERTKKLSRGCNASFLALVPKKDDPLLISEYRPISLLGCTYKVIAKLLAKRMAAVMDKLISSNQSAFLKNRQIVDSVLIANEIVHHAKKKGLKMLLFKVDFEKAFDSVNWDFLISIMKQMGFGHIWCDWIKGCLSSASVSVLVNGSPSSEFQMTRGLRQGDPLSPFLFLIIGEALQTMTKEACEKGLFKGIKLATNSENLSLIQYADDALFMGKWSTNSMRNLLNLLHCFNEVSGLKINISKSCLFGIGIRSEKVSEAARELKCQAGIIKQLEGIRRRFFWGITNNSKGICWVAWNKVMAEKEYGGLNIQSLKVKNLALLAKWLWRFLTTGDALWKSVIMELHGSLEKNPRPETDLSSPWKTIMKVNDEIENLGVELLSGFFRSTANGSPMTFWDLNWSASGPKLKEIFPRLYAKEVNKNIPFKDRWKCTSNKWHGSWEWRSSLRGRTLADLKNLEDLLNNMNFKTEGNDSWHWFLDPQGNFSVNKLSKLLQKQMRVTGSSNGGIKQWNPLVPIKINVFIWRMLHNALPSLINLQARGIQVESTNCVFCGLEREDLDHCLFRCCKVEVIWRKVWSWCKISAPRFDSVASFNNLLRFHGQDQVKTKIFHAISLVTLWAIWGWRNKVAHSDHDNIVKCLQEDIFPSVQRLAALWIVNRSPKAEICWRQWALSPSF
ncbi:hypothetical protein OSB04_006020 [Centaurea solstitialis]|uniref:Reverse transcriptase domain-containing protein n=1 Tax=Centaurea solstitialis TaxID=347529 RepID=A0AA38TTU1_9ASTR|nr:hypothetical protein OSB04_006020 [Centaurea solstitialis]